MCLTIVLVATASASVFAVRDAPSGDDWSIVVLACVVLIPLEAWGAVPALAAPPTRGGEPAVVVTLVLTNGLWVALGALLPIGLAGLTVGFGSTVGSLLARVPSLNTPLDRLALILGSSWLRAIEVMALVGLLHLIVGDSSPAGWLLVAGAVAITANLGWYLFDHALLDWARRERTPLPHVAAVARLVPVDLAMFLIPVLSYEAGGFAALCLAVVAATGLSLSQRRSIRHSVEIERRDRQREELLRSVLEVAAIQRDELARNLHDGPLQVLLAASLELSDEQVDAQRRARVVEQLTRAASDLRNTIRGIPTTTMEHGVREAISRRCEVARAVFSDVAFSFVAEPPLSDDIGVIAYQVIQEAIANAEKHSSGSSLTVSVRAKGPWITILVSDNGRGFDIEEPLDSTHLGLIAMRERTEYAGGRLEIESQVGAGTSVTISLPRRPVTASGVDVPVGQTLGRRNRSNSTTG
jgi:signal transduction histidine kinase